MHEDRARRGKTLCADCKYPLMRLNNFDGDSSRNAPEFGARGIDTAADLGWSFVLLPWRMVRKLWRGNEPKKRRKQVEKLRADILPSEPDAMICPMCLRVFFPDELRG